MGQCARNGNQETVRGFLIPDNFALGDRQSVVQTDIFAVDFVLGNADIVERHVFDGGGVGRGRAFGNGAQIGAGDRIFGVMTRDAHAGAVDKIITRHEQNDQKQDKNIHHSPLRFIKSLANISGKFNRKTIFNARDMQMKKYLLILLLAGCGFHPMFVGDDADVYVPPIRGINGIELRNALNAKFGGQHDSNAQFTLTVNLADPVTQYKALEPTGDASWREVQLTASYTLTRGDETIATGQERASESYAFVRYLVAANASYNNAVQNTIKQLSDKISTRVFAETYKYAQKTPAQQ